MTLIPLDSFFKKLACKGIFVFLFYFFQAQQNNLNTLKSRVLFNLRPYVFLSF